MPAEKQSFGPGLLFFFCHSKGIADAPERQESWAILQFLSLLLPFPFPVNLIFIMIAKHFLSVFWSRSAGYLVFWRK